MGIIGDLVRIIALMYGIKAGCDTEIFAGGNSPNFDLINYS